MVLHNSIADRADSVRKFVDPLSRCVLIFLINRIVFWPAGQNCFEIKTKNNLTE
jgi:hypothetical protein